MKRLDQQNGTDVIALIVIGCGVVCDRTVKLRGSHAANLI